MPDYDVVVVGSGVAGALCAAGLAGNGRRVLVLEAAENGLGAYQREQFRRIWDPAPGKSWNTPYTKTNGIKFYPSPDNADKDTYIERVGVDPNNTLKTFKGYYQRLVGGSTWAWRGNTPRMMPNDFLLKSKYFAAVPIPDGANVADWPLSYNDMKPWYLKAEEELGVAGDADEWEALTPRDGKQYPMPAQPKSYGDKRLIERLGVHKVELDGEEIPAQILTMAQARNTRPYDGRPACEGNHNCIPLCPTSAKYDASVHLKRAHLNGVEIRSGCVVTKLQTKGNSIGSVVYKQWNSDSPQTERSVSAKIVILAANPIETPKILFQSKLFGEDDPYVGKHLMDHIQGECLGLADETDPIYPFRGPQTLCGIDSVRDGRYRSKFASFRMTLGNDGWGRAGNPTSVLEEMLDPAVPASFVIGKKLRRDAVSRLTRLVRFGFSTEQLPHAENSVALADKVDALGVPRPKVKFKVHEYTQEALRQGYRVSRELFHAMGVTHVDHEGKPGKEEFEVNDWNTAAHPMGTCRMGNDKSDSVVDKYGRCHNYPNLFLAGASIFPTGSATNPCLTLSALALMAVHHIRSTEL